MRIIPRLEIKGQNLVKGVQFDGLRVLGKPRDFARVYYEEGADELIYIDIVASLYERRILPEVVSETAKEIFIPLTVGGGIRSLEDIEVLLSAGADKVCINTAALKRPQLLQEAARRFGSQCIVAGIEAKRSECGSFFEAYAENGRQPSGKKVLEWARQACELGAGEILLTSVDKEGTFEGFDLELFKGFSEFQIPVIVAGGCGRLSDIDSLLDSFKPDGIACSSLFHYKYLEAVLADEENRRRADFLNFQTDNYSMGEAKKQNEPAFIRQVKELVQKKGMSVRI